ncbi:hypothetical protein GCM10029964_002550 [Kibdelosporangium lantanae]
MGEVRDQAEGEPFVHKGHSGYARFPVSQGTLGVEQVGHHHGTGISRRRGLHAGRVGVADRHEHAGGDEPLDRVDGAGQFRREGDHPQRWQQFEGGVHALGGRRDHQAGVVHTRPFGGQEWAFQVHAKGSRARTVHSRHHAGQQPGLVQLLGQVRGDECGQKSRHAGTRQTTDNTTHAVVVDLGEVNAERAVDLDVHQAGVSRPGRGSPVGACVTSAIRPSSMRTDTGPVMPRPIRAFSAARTVLKLPLQLVQTSASVSANSPSSLVSF